MPPTYPPYPWTVFLQVAWTALCGGRRSFRRDALRCTSGLALEVRGAENIPQAGPAVVVVNHYHRPGFGAQWIALAVSSVTPVEIHWAMTGAWTDKGDLGAASRTWVSPFFLPRLARVYGFTSMPPMPPHPHEVGARAEAVRHFLQAARRTPAPILGVSPEGQDNPAGGLMRPHPGVGRMLALLAGMGYSFIPVGVREDAAALLLVFGPPLHLDLPGGRSVEQRDRQTSDRVMEAIAALLPAELRGPYAANCSD